MHHFQQETQDRRAEGRNQRGSCPSPERRSNQPHLKVRLSSSQRGSQAAASTLASSIHNSFQRQGKEKNFKCPLPPDESEVEMSAYDATFEDRESEKEKKRRSKPSKHQLSVHLAVINWTMKVF